MDNYFDEKFNCPSPYTPAGVSFYAGGNWVTCRDQFANVMPNYQTFYFSHPHNSGKNVADFFKVVEEKLQVGEFSLFASSQLANITHVRPSNWWMQCPMRRSIFTALLRVSPNYNGNNFDNIVGALNSKASVAFKYFLDGNTHFLGSSKPGGASGFYHYFGNAKIDKVKSLLGKNPKPKMINKIKKIIKGTTSLGPK